MKFNGKIRRKRPGISQGGRFAPTGRKYAFLGRARMDRFEDVLSNSVMQSLGGTGLHTSSHSGMRIDKSRCFSVKKAVYPCWKRKEARGRENNAWFHSEKALFDSRLKESILWIKEFQRGY